MDDNVLYQQVTEQQFKEYILGLKRSMFIDTMFNCDPNIVIYRSTRTEYPFGRILKYSSGYNEYYLVINTATN